MLRQAYDQGPAVVTNNVVDYERLRRQGRQSDDLLLALIYTSDRTFPRDRRYIGRLVNALDRACATDAVQAAGGVLWLQPVPPG